MSDTHGSLLNITTGLLLMLKARGPDQATEGHRNVRPREVEGTIKTKDPVGLMVSSPRIEEISVKSNDLTRRVAYS